VLADGGNEVHFGKVDGACALSALRFWRSIPDHETLLVNNSGLLPGERQERRESRCSARWRSDGRRRAAARDDLAAPGQEVATNELSAPGGQRMPGGPAFTAQSAAHALWIRRGQWCSRCKPVALACQAAPVRRSDNEVNIPHERAVPEPLQGESQGLSRRWTPFG
jgi:hypothetical protein